jgi:Domain of unknown function (DUF4440)
MRIAHTALSLAFGFYMATAAWGQPDAVSVKASQPETGRAEILRAFEQQIEDAISRRDVAFLDRITAPTFTRTDQNGNVEGRAAVFAQIRKPPPTADIISRKITRETQQVQLHGDVGISRSETIVRGPRRAFSTTAVKVYRWRTSRWQLLSHTTISVTEAAGNDAQYEKLREDFYVTLAGRFPFGSDRAASADPGAVQSFFETYGPALAPLRARLEAERPGSEAAAVIGQLQRVQTALAPMLAGPGPLSYVVDVAFFTDPTLAKGQRQIVEGRLGTTPADEAKIPHGARDFTWAMGQPVRLSLRWALNAPSLPIESITDPAGECRPPAGGGVANVRIDDTWALLRLIARYQARDGGDLDGSDSGIPVAFTIPVCANLQRARGGDDRPGPARVFLRLSLSAKVRTPGKPDRLVPVALPDFPRSVPRLDGSDSVP